MQLALSHLGYRPDSPKTVTLCPGADYTLEHWDIPYALAINAINAIAWL
jgi:hypothetical protein